MCILNIHIVVRIRFADARFKENSCYLRYLLSQSTDYVMRCQKTRRFCELN